MRALLFSSMTSLLMACPGTSTTVDTDEDTDTQVDAGFACHDIVCASDEVCVIGVGGAPPPPGEDGISASCQPAPEDCADEPTCDCALDAGICLEFAGDCDDASGNVECTIYYP